MRKISAEEQILLEEHLVKKPIRYVELYNELYVHYASAVESSEQSLELTLAQLDHDFTYSKVERLNSQVQTKTKKTVRQLYKKELLNFFAWPQVMITLLSCSAIYLLVTHFDLKTLFWTLTLPSMVVLISIMFYPYFLKHFAASKSKRLKSSFYESVSHLLSMPITWFNLCVFLPVLVAEPDQDRFAFFTNYPFVFAFLLLFMVFTVYLGAKVLRTKIRIQYL